MVAAGSIATTAHNRQAAIEELRVDLQTKSDQDRAEREQKPAEVQGKILRSHLALRLNLQLNEFKT